MRRSVLSVDRAEPSFIIERNREKSKKSKKLSLVILHFEANVQNLGETFDRRLIDSMVAFAPQETFAFGLNLLKNNGTSSGFDYLCAMHLA